MVIPLREESTVQCTRSINSNDAQSELQLCAFHNLIIFEENSCLLAVATPGINCGESCNSMTLISADVLYKELGKKCR